MPFLRHRGAIALAALGSLIMLAACQTNIAPPSNTGLTATESVAAPESAQPVVARVATAHPPGSLDPAQVSLSDAVGSDLVENLYVGLTQLTPDTNGVAPALAREWTVSSDGLRWTFALREDVMWVAFDPATNGVTALRPVTADDVVYAVWRACHPATAAPHAAALFTVKGCRQINRTDPAIITDQLLSNTIRVSTTDPASLSIELETPAADFLTATAMPVMRPVAREAFAETEAEWRDAGLNASSGPFVMAAYAPGDSMTLAANPQWPLPREGNLTAVEIRFAADEASAYAAFQAGEADIAPLPEEQAAAANLLRVEPRVTFLVFAADQPPMNDVRVRRALAAAIDRQRLVSDALNGNGFAAAGFTPPGSVAAPLHGQLTAPAFSPDNAREQLAAAGYANCQLLPRVTVVTDRSQASMTLALAVARMWQDNLLCNETRFDIQQIDMRLLLEQINTPLAAEWQTRPHLSLMTWQADYPDAANWLGDLLHCERGYLQVGRPCELADDLIERAATERGLDARASLYAESEALLFGPEGLQPIAPLYTHAAPLAVQPWLSLPTGGSPAISGPMRYDRWQINRAQ